MDKKAEADLNVLAYKIVKEATKDKNEPKKEDKNKPEK